MMQPSCLQPCELAGSVQPAEDTGVCRRVWGKEPRHQSELHRIAGIRPWGQEMGEWLWPHALSRGEKTPARHGGESSPSTSAPLYGGHEGRWGHPWGTYQPSEEGSGELCTPFGEGGTQRTSAGTEHIIQQSFPNPCPLWGPTPSTLKASASALGTALARTRVLDAQIRELAASCSCAGCPGSQWGHYSLTDNP